MLGGLMYNANQGYNKHGGMPKGKRDFAMDNLNNCLMPEY